MSLMPEVLPRLMKQYWSMHDQVLWGATFIISSFQVEEGESSGTVYVPNDYSTLAKTHKECSKTVQKLVTARQDLEHNVKLYTNMSNRFKELKEEHLGCDGMIKTLEKERDIDLRINKIYNTNQILGLEKKLAKKNSELIIAKKEGLSVARTDEEILAVSKKTEGFDALSDRKLYHKYGKLFEVEYPYIPKEFSRALAGPSVPTT
ncbi:hypothetical protein Tco_1019475 [Tanacetum coccineum]|uniref:Uncharacterized protein n=1 Tax=Tanacetum coccineum TaxID=301880 RepID=A0ABQ5FYP3_9ASTR